MGASCGELPEVKSETTEVLSRGRLDVETDVMGKFKFSRLAMTKRGTADDGALHSSSDALRQIALFQKHRN